MKINTGTCSGKTAPKPKLKISDVVPTGGVFTLCGTTYIRGFLHPLSSSWGAGAVAKLEVTKLTTGAREDFQDSEWTSSYDYYPNAELYIGPPAPRP